MALNSRETMLLHINNIELPGFELVPTAKRLIPKLFDSMGWAAVGPDVIERAIIDIHESRVMVALKTSRVQPEVVVKRVNTTIFRGDLVTQIVAEGSIPEFLEVLEVARSLPWNSYYIMRDFGNIWTKDEVLDLECVREHIEAAKKAEIDALHVFLNTGKR
jgi:hypothetical protein